MRRWLLGMLSLAAFPCVVLAALAVTGNAAWPPVLAGVVLVAAWSGVLAVRRSQAWAALAARADGAGRQARVLQDRAAQAEAQARADAAIVERLPDPLIVLGADRQVRGANRAARAAFGDDLAAVLRQPGLRAAFDRALAEGGAPSADLVLPAPALREVQATVIALDPAPGARLVAVLSDRTRERAVERMRADFVANASHELRTPLASLIGFIETLQGPARDDEPARHRFLGIMAEQAARMNRLIDDLLSLSRIELTEHQAPEDRVDLAALATHLAAAFEPRVKARGIRLDAALAADLPLVPGDEDQLSQVLQNLLDNAVKYGRENGVLRLSAHRAAVDGRQWPARPGVLLAVADDGQGIARAHLPRLTERFYRVDKGRSRAVGGTGLGLAIVKHIVNRHRGRMLVESEEGKGTTVTVWLPVAG